MARDGDWSLLHNGKDPTPGDPAVLLEIQQKMDGLKQVADEVNAGLTTILNQGEGKFVGKTADALRGKISGELKEFVQALSESFSVASTAVGAYRTAVEESQAKADAALTTAQGLDKNAEDYQTQLDGPKKDADDARSDLQGAARTLEGELRRAGQMVKLPISGWDIFWEIFNILTIIISIVAIFVGGPLGLLAFAMNAALFVKTAVDYAQGKASALELGLSIVGLLGPTTKAISFIGLLKNIGTGAKTLFTTAKTVVFSTTKGFARIALNPAMVGKVVLNTIKAVPSMALAALKSVPALLSTAGGFARSSWQGISFAVRRDFFLSTWTATGTMGKIGAYVMTLGGRAFDLAVNALLPLNYAEIAAFGYRGATKLAVLERGFGVGLSQAGKVTAGGLGAGLELSGPLTPPTSSSMDLGLGGLGKGLDFGASPGFTINSTTGLLEPGPLTVGGDFKPVSGISSDLGGLGNLSAVDRLKALDEFTGFGRTENGVLVPTGTLGDGGGVVLSPGGLDASSPSLAANGGVSTAGFDSSALPGLAPQRFKATAPTSFTGGDGLNFAHSAVVNADTDFKLGAYEMDALANGEVHIVSANRDGITVQIGESPGLSSGGQQGLTQHTPTSSVNTTTTTATPGVATGQGLTTGQGLATGQGLTTGQGLSPTTSLGGIKAADVNVTAFDSARSQDLALNLLGRQEPPKTIVTEAGAVPKGTSQQFVGPTGATTAGPRGGDLGGGGASPLGQEVSLPRQDVSLSSWEGELSSPQGVSAATNLDRAGVRSTGFDLAGTRSDLEASAAATTTTSVPPLTAEGTPVALRPRPVETPGVRPEPLRPQQSNAPLPGGQHGPPSPTPDATPAPGAPGPTGAAPDEMSDLLDDVPASASDLKGKGPALPPPTAATSHVPTQPTPLLPTHVPPGGLHDGAVAARNIDIGRQGRHDIITGGVGGREGVARLQAWLDYEQALSDLGRARELQAIAAREVGGPSSGVSLAEAAARLETSKAELTLASAENALRRLGIDPQTMHGELTDLMGRVPSDRGRLPGGMLTAQPGPALAELNASRIELHTASGNSRMMHGNDLVPGSSVQQVDDTFVATLDTHPGRRWTYDADGRLQHSELALGGTAPGGITHIRTSPANEHALLDATNAPVATHTLTSGPGGSHLLTDTTTGDVWQYGHDGALHHHDIALTGPDLPGGATHIRQPPGAAPTLVDASGQPVTAYTTAPAPGGGYTVTETATNNVRHYDAGGALRHHDIAVAGPQAPGAATHVRTTPGAGPTLVDGAGTPVGGFTVAPDGAGGFRVTDDTTNDILRYGSDGALHHVDTAVHPGTGSLPGAGTHIRSSPNAPGPTLVDAHGNTIAGYDVAPAATGGHTVTHPATGDVWHVGAGGALNRFDLAVRPHGLDALPGTHLSTTYGPGGTTHTLIDGTGTAVPAHTVTPGTVVPGGHTVTDTATGHGWHLAPDGTVRAHDLVLTGPAQAPLPGAATHLRTTEGPGGTVRLHDGTGAIDGYTVAPLPGGGRTVTDDATGVVWDLDAGGRLTGQHVPLRDGTAGNLPTVNRIDVTYPQGGGQIVTSGPAAGTHTVTPLTSAVDGSISGFTVRANPVNGQAANATEAWRFDASGQLTAYDLPLTGNRPSQLAGQVTHVRTTYDPTGAVTGHLVDTPPSVPTTSFTVARDNVTGNYTVTRPNHPVVGRDAQVFDPTGQLVSEKVAVHAYGRATGKFWEVDHTANTARRLLDDGNADPGYFGNGSWRQNGDRFTITSNGVTQFEREVLADGRVLHVDASTKGKADQWLSFQPNGGSVKHGDRIYNPDRQTVHDTHHGGSNLVMGSGQIRQYHTLSNGYVRAEEVAGGRWIWQRFDAQGRFVTGGDRHVVRFETGFEDVFTHNGTQVVAHKKYGDYGYFDTARKFREYDVSLDANNAVRYDPNSYKEFSIQSKMTAWKETLSDGTTHLEVRRWHEQRIPAMFWHEKVDMRWYNGAFGQDSLNQIFLWTETAADGTIVKGLRKTAPDLSWVDIDQHGRAFRGTRNLDGGKVVEYGKTGGVWDPAPPPPVPGGNRAFQVNWSYTDNSLAGTRHVDGNGNWQDVFNNAGVESVAHRSQGGGWREYKAEFPQRGTALDDKQGIWVDKNDLNQITGRRDLFTNGDGAQHYLEGLGNPRKKNWTWHAYDPNGATAPGPNGRYADPLESGKRINNRGSATSPTWDDSFKDFGRRGDLVREFNALTNDHKLHVTPVSAANGGPVRFKVEEFDAGGNLVADGAHRVYTGRPGSDTWTDVAAGFAVRTKNGIRVREFDHTVGDGVTGPQRTPVAGDANTWKEFDQGKVVSSKAPVPGAAGRYRETDHLWSQWREYQDGNLIAQKTISGRVWETDAFGRWNSSKFWESPQFPRVDPDRGVGAAGDTGWRLAGRDMTYRGLGAEFRGYSRQLRDPWHEQWAGVAPGGGESRIMSKAARVTRKIAVDFAIGFSSEFLAGLLVNGIDAAVNKREFTWKDIAKATLSGAIGGSVKAGSTILHDATAFGQLRQGMWNMDFSKNFNRHNYASVDDWNSEWTSHEFARRWRTATYDISAGIVTSAITSFASNAANAAIFGVGGVQLSGTDALLAGAWGMAGSLAGQAIGVPFRVTHVVAGSRLYHRGGLGDIGFNLGLSILQSGFSRLLLNGANISTTNAVPPVPQTLQIPLDGEGFDVPETFLPAHHFPTTDPDNTEAS